MEKRRIILDTDIGPDCDDCGALAILDRACADGKIDLLGVTHCTSDLLSVDVIAAINDWFVVSAPIGQTDRKEFFADATKVHKAGLGHLPRVRKERAGDRKACSGSSDAWLAENTGVTFVLIGPLGNLADLLDSEPDEISPLDGVSLVRKSVDKVVIMGGNFENTATRNSISSATFPRRDSRRKVPRADRLVRVRGGSERHYRRDAEGLPRGLPGKARVRETH